MIVCHCSLLAECVCNNLSEASSSYGINRYCRKIHVMLRRNVHTLPLMILTFSFRSFISLQTLRLSIINYSLFA
jgi:hypothetical protein